MSDLMTPVLRALDARRQPLVFFVRDDDAGWEDGALWALLDCMADTRVPIDLAVIPQATGQRLADALCARIDAAPGLLGVHQHGLAHTNHERVGRRCEFGHARAPMAQRKDLRQGRARLQTLFGHRLDDIFTPPWNRCASYTPALLCEVGLTALSRDRSAASQQDMPELRVDVDWCKYRRGTDDGGAALARAMMQAVRDRADDAEPLGLMLHHAQMGAADLQLLRLWLPSLREHPLLRCVPMRRALAPRAPELH